MTIRSQTHEPHPFVYSIDPRKKTCATCGKPISDPLHRVPSSDLPAAA